MDYMEEVMSWQEDNSVIDRLVQQAIGVQLESDNTPIPEEGENYA